MARGQRDFGQYSAKSNIGSLSDMADLAVRLGSIVEFDRRGDVVYLDDYESPLAKFYDASSAGCSARLGSDYARSGAQSLVLATEGTINLFAAANHYINPLVIGRHGVKVSLAIPGMLEHDAYYEIYFDYFDGTDNVVGGVQLNPYDKTIKYINAAGVPTTFETELNTHSSRGYNLHNLKLVIDMVEEKYVRLLYDNFTWDLSAYSLSKDASTDAPLVSVVCLIKDLEGHAHTIYQDDFVYTINEP